MPFRRRPRRRPRRTLTKAVRSEVKRIAFSTQETKHHRVEVDSAFDNQGTLVELNTVDSQGDASGQFVGQEIRQMGIRLRGKLTQSDSNNVVRLIVFTPSAQFESALTAGTQSAADLLYFPTNWSAIREPQVSKVYHDKNYVLNIASGQNDMIRLVNNWINLRMRKYKINETTSPMTGSNKVYLFMMSDSGVAPHPIFQFASTLYYKDA